MCQLNGHLSRGSNRRIPPRNIFGESYVMCSQCQLSPWRLRFPRRNLDIYTIVLGPDWKLRTAHRYFAASWLPRKARTSAHVHVSSEYSARSNSLTLGPCNIRKSNLDIAFRGVAHLEFLCHMHQRANGPIRPL